MLTFFLFISFIAIYYAHISSNQSSDLTTVDVEKFPPSLAITTELCAGIVDKDLPLVEIAREELLEECGYKVTSDRIELVMTYK
jgi:8-oxo-dGTP pyrophosphatase MutT (NUDIX family)